MGFDKDQLINQLLEEHPIYDIVSFNEFNLNEKFQKNPYLGIQYRDLLNKEKQRYEELEEMYEKLQGDRYHHYRFEIDEDLSKPEIEKYYLPKDPKILKMKEILRKQKLRIGFFDACVKGIDRAYWSMKEFSNNLK